MHGMALDQNDRVVRPAILWNDGRTENRQKYLNEVIGKAADRALRATLPLRGLRHRKFFWMKENEPEKLFRVKKIMLPKDFFGIPSIGKFLHRCFGCFRHSAF